MWKIPFYPFSADQHFLLLFTILNCFFHWFSLIFSLYQCISHVSPWIFPFIDASAETVAPLQRSTSNRRLHLTGNDMFKCQNKGIHVDIMVKSCEIHGEIMVSSWWKSWWTSCEIRVTSCAMTIQNWSAKNDPQSPMNYRRTILAETWRVKWKVFWSILLKADPGRHSLNIILLETSKPQSTMVNFDSGFSLL